ELTNMSNLIHIATAADENFALPVAVMLRSIIDNLNKYYTIHASILDCGLSIRSRKHIIASLPKAWITLNFYHLNNDLFRGLRVDGHVSQATYARLFIDQVFHKQIDKLLYLDGDTLSVHDISILWNISVEHFFLAAIQDPVAGVVGKSPQMMHWAGWDVAEGTKIFNAGVMLINTRKWEQEGICKKAIEVARSFPQRMKWWDQCALNYVIRGKFLNIDLKWNVMPHLYYPPNCFDVIYSRDIIEAAIRDPYIVHFSGNNRPWRGCNRHWRETDFYRYLYRTKYRKRVPFAPWMGRGRTSFHKIARYSQNLYQQFASGLSSGVFDINNGESKGST
ncbi:MAG: glycosyltransferase family 8 protein, partial [Methylacidiphilales bacterium]|nr:glycosyltransferase family 8 protein [Candidatus Methylacidiphilales bacterium]